MDKFEARYHLIRMAVFDPVYLLENNVCDDQDFTQLIDEIVRLKELDEIIGSPKPEVSRG